MDSNMSQAILMAAGVLIGIMILSLLIFARSDISSYFLNQSNLNQQKVIDNFNNKWVKYEVTPSDVSPSATDSQARKVTLTLMDVTSLAYDIADNNYQFLLRNESAGVTVSKSLDYLLGLTSKDTDAYGALIETNIIREIGCSSTNCWDFLDIDGSKGASYFKTAPEECKIAHRYFCTISVDESTGFVTEITVNKSTRDKISRNHYGSSASDSTYSLDGDDG